MPRVDAHIKRDLETAKALVESVTGVDDERFRGQFSVEENIVLLRALMDLQIKLEREISRGY